MTTVSIDSIQQDFKKYLQRVLHGESITIVQAGRPVAELRPPSSREALRPFGLCEDEFIVPDDFDAPLPEDILSEFEGK